MQSPFRHTVIYDGTCPLCRSSVERLRGMDRRETLAFVPAGDPAVGRRWPELSPDALGKSLHLVSPSGEVRRGADAVEAVLGLLPGYRWGTWLFRIPLARPLARLVYQWVARNRHRISCREHCSGE